MKSDLGDKQIDLNRVSPLTLGDLIALERELQTMHAKIQAQFKPLAELVSHYGAMFNSLSRVINDHLPPFNLPKVPTLNLPEDPSS